VEAYELDRLRTMMIEMIQQPETFKQWFGSFVTTPRHELDIAPAEPPYAQDEVLDALLEGECLTRLSGLRVLNVGDSVFINSEPLEMSDPAAADAPLDDKDIVLIDMRAHAAAGNRERDHQVV